MTFFKLFFCSQRNPNVAFLGLARLCLVRTQTFRAYLLWRQGGSAGIQGTNISPLKVAGKMIFLFYRCDMLCFSWRVSWKMAINAKIIKWKYHWTWWMKYAILETHLLTVSFSIQDLWMNHSWYWIRIFLRYNMKSLWRNGESSTQIGRIKINASCFFAGSWHTGIFTPTSLRLRTNFLDA